jgi:hypothetical protein
LDNLRELAASGKPFGHGILVEAAESRSGEQHLALCDVRVIRGTIGPPDRCATVAIITKDITLLRAGAHGTVMCLASASIRLGGSIDIRFSVQTKRTLSDFSDSFSEMLSNDLHMVTEQNSENYHGQIDSISFRSTAPLRDSPILKGGWRESLDFDVSLSRRSDGFDVYGTAKPLVCPTASGQSVDYHGLTDAQRQAYATALDRYVNGAIIRSCPKAKQIDAKQILCE